MYHPVAKNDGGGGLTFGQARNTTEACWLRLYTTQWGCLVSIPIRGGCSEVKVVATTVVEVKGGLACKLWWPEVAILAFSREKQREIRFQPRCF